MDDPNSGNASSTVPDPGSDLEAPISFVPPGWNPPQPGADPHVGSLPLQVSPPPPLASAPLEPEAVAKDRRTWPVILGVVALAVSLVAVIAVVRSFSAAPVTPGPASDATCGPPPPVALGPPPSWVRVLGGMSNDDFHAVAVAPDWNVIVAGQTSSGGGHFPAYRARSPVVAKLSETGDLVWARSYDSGAELYAVAVLPDGSIIVAGRDGAYGGDFPSAPGHFAAMVAKLSPTGDVLWGKTFGGSGPETFWSVAVGPDGSIVAAGTTGSPDGDFPLPRVPENDADMDGVVVKLNGSGELMWARTFGGSGYDGLKSVAVAPDGRIAVAGFANSPDGDFPTPASKHTEALVITLDESGNLEWGETFGGEGYDRFDSVAFAPDGTVVAAGMSVFGEVIGSTPGITMAMMVALDPSGEPLWEGIYGGSGDDHFTSVVAQPDGTIVAVGESGSRDGDIPMRHAGEKADAFAITLDQDGSILWQRAYGGSDFDSFRSAVSVPGSGIVAVGCTYSRDGDFPVAHPGHDTDAIVVCLACGM